MATQQQIGKAIIRLRKTRGISQESLAIEAGVDRRYMSDLENGKRNVSLAVLNRIASFFCVPLSSLCKEAEQTTLTLQELKQALVEQGFEESVVLVDPDFCSAVVGISQDGRVVYSFEKMVQYLMLNDNMSHDEAVNYIEYNTIRAIPYMGAISPIVINSI